jgi:hypothetical protein
LRRSSTAAPACGPRRSSPRCRRDGVSPGCLRTCAPTSTSCWTPAPSPSARTWPTIARRPTSPPTPPPRPFWRTPELSSAPNH